MRFPQVQYCVSQTGRPDDGTDVTGYYNNEFDVLMFPEDEWQPHITTSIAGVSKATATRDLQELLQQGAIILWGDSGGRSTRYQVNL